LFFVFILGVVENVVAGILHREEELYCWWRSGKKEVKVCCEKNKQVFFSSKAGGALEKLTLFPIKWVSRIFYYFNQ
jgi:hypothetical protein